MNSILAGLSFQLIFDSSADALLITDVTGQVLLANPVAQQLLGYSENAILNLKVEDLIPARYRSKHLSVREVFSSKPEKRAMGKGREIYALRNDGQELSVEISLTPLSADEHAYTLINMQDNTERKQAADILKKSRDQLKTFIHNAPLSIAMFDRSMNYLEYSARWLLQYGRGYPDLIGLNHYEVHPDLPDQWKIVHQQVLAGATLERIEDSWTQNDGNTCWLRWSALPWLDGNSEISGIIIAAEDITAQKIMEKKLIEQRNDLDNLQKIHIASQTVSAIAHELNQPLAAISAYSEVALKSLRSDAVDLPTLNRALKGCVEQSLRAGKSLHELLNFLSAGKFIIEPFDLNDTVHDALSLVQNDGFGGFLRKLELEQGLPPVLGNRTQIRKVLVNLLSNGAEAMREAGLPAGAINITVKTMAETKMAQVTVQDSGPGLNAETTKRVFEPFFTTKPDGIGLGLAISRSMIEANGGQLWLEPNTTQGAIFHFTLPFAA